LDYFEGNKRMVFELIIAVEFCTCH